VAGLKTPPWTAAGAAVAAGPAGALAAGRSVTAGVVVAGAAFVDAAAEEYGFDRSKITAVGYSNGANVAASTILLHPGLLRAAVLFRAMVPFEPDLTPELSGMPVFLAAGRMDRMIPPDNTQRLADILLEAGADVDLRWRNTGHPLTYEEVGEAKAWLSEVLPRLSGPQVDRE